MASQAKRLPTNVEGDFFVDETCIDCDTCRWMAPEVFDRAGEHSRVHRQPRDANETEAALRALLACPTGSIGDAGKHDLTAARAAFPMPIDGEVHHCGYHAESSFGAASYFIRRPAARGGNVVVDSPRFTNALVRRIEEMGGIATMFLTHGDDLADQAKYARHFGCVRVMHAADAPAEIERRIEGIEPVTLDPELLVIPTPGHTRGSACLLFRDAYLFSGDHVAWSESRRRIIGFRDACWYSWDRQIESMARLAGHRFEWILPGHGRRCHLSADRMAAEMARCVDWMRAAS
jgi:glyoxylase-like metal-dependent hydrolase (beta-lactamase superfamily II)/ferredoxin